MNFRNGINREDLLNCDDADDENEQLKEFYESNLQYLKKYPEKTVLADIARMIHKTLLGEVYWRKYAVILGITDSDELDKIEVSAEKNKEQELYTVFTRVLPKTKGFDHIIRMLLIEKRFDVLSKIHHDAKGLIEKNLNTHVKSLAMIEPQYSSNQWTSSNACSIQELVSEASFSNSSNCYKANSYSCTQSPALHIEKENLQLSSKSDSCKTETIIPDSTVDCENHLEQNLPSEKYIIPSAPMQENLTEEKISVFILHTKPDTDYARQLSEKLRKAGFKVKTMSDMEVVLAMNDIEALRAIFEEVDFIVPIVSDNLFKVIHTPHLNQLVESTDAVNNKIFYQWIMNEYQCNSCINYRVRPVIPPGMNRQKLIKDIIFKFSFRLGVEDDKLIRILRETKDLIPEYRLQVNCE